MYVLRKKKFLLAKQINFFVNIKEDCEAYYESYLTFSKFLNHHPKIVSNFI